jgi:hypothetical protein
MTRMHILSKLFLLLFLGGCAHGGGPLVFVVGHTVGIDIQATSASTATPGLTVGYKSLDVAVVPTQQDKAAGDSLLGCYAVGQGGSEIPTLCPGSKPALPIAKPAMHSVDDLWMPRPGQQRVNSSERRDESTYLQKVVAAAPAAPARAIAAPPANNEEADKFAESVVDAYSVYASFNTSAKAGGSAPGVGIGEVFATGDAAVQLAEGINYYSSRAGNALIVKAQGDSSCIAQLTAAKQAGVDMTKVPACPSATTESNPAPTLSTVAPTSGSAPQAGASAGTVVATTLTGTGFTSASSVGILGAAGVTADKPKASSDGKTITVNLTIAVGAATGARGIFVSNPTPGGGSTLSQTFTVN